MRALVHLLELGDGSRLANFKMLDVKQCCLGTGGVLLIGRLLCHPKCCFEEVDLSFQNVGVEGAKAIAEGIRKLKTLRVLHMHTCRLGREGGQVLLDLLQEVVHSGHDGWEGMVGTSHTLRKLDLQNNLLGTEVSTRLQELADDQDIEVVLFGNRVMSEILNAVTHGLGFVFAIAGTVILGIGATGKEDHYKVAIGIYCASLLFLFLSSMLYHSFFALGPTVNRIFEFFDHVAIYCLIAGSYTPFLLITFHGKLWAQILLAVMWVLALFGASLTMLYNGPHKVHVENCLYLVMGWLICFFVADVIDAIGRQGFYWLLAGGVLYTLGVPWFLKDGKTLGIPDHTIWHMFVLAAAIAHFLCIYWYVVDPEPKYKKLG